MGGCLTKNKPRDRPAKLEAKPLTLASIVPDDEKKGLREVSPSEETSADRGGLPWMMMGEVPKSPVSEETAALAYDEVDLADVETRPSTDTSLETENQRMAELLVLQCYVENAPLNDGSPAFVLPAV
jgi:hypothetical protein